MANVRPFRGLLYNPAVVGPLERVTAPPYDAISPTERDRYLQAGRFNVVRIILGMDEPGDDDRSNRYTRAASWLEEWRASGVLIQVSQPMVFPYEMAFHHRGAERRVAGVIVEVDIEPWGGSIQPHERTVTEQVQDRLALLRAVRANLSPLYAVFPGPSASLSAFTSRTMGRPPDRQTEDEDGTLHRLWAVADPGNEVGRALRSEPLMIADGHHRYAVALAHRDEMRAQAGSGPWDAVMMLVVDAASQDPPVQAIHRLVTGVARPVPPGRQVRDLQEILGTVNDDDVTFGIVRLEGGRIVHRVGRLGGQPPTVRALHGQLLDGMAGPRIAFTHDATTAEQAVLDGRAETAFILPPTTVGRVRRVVLSGGRLPQKSTYFWPKPRTGMVIRPLEP